ncbi:retinol dehydrogenase 8 [Seiridium cupressi]
MSAPASFSMPKRSLTWLITGCSSGFGLELVRIAQANGHFVIATSRNPSRTPELVSEVEGKGGKWVRLDVDDPNSAQVIDDIEKQGPAIDVLVNNAGFGLYGASEQFTEEEVHRQFETVFFGAYRLTRTAVRHMRQRRFGVVVDISSASAIRPVTTMGIYGAAKAALESVHKTLAREVAEFNIRFLTVNPGIFNTPSKQNLTVPTVISQPPKTGQETVLEEAVLLLDWSWSLQYQTQPLVEDYEKGPVGDTLNRLKAHSVPVDGDTKKGIKAIYEVIVCEGVGEGHEAEPVLPLGRDASRLVAANIAQWQHTIEVFGGVCNNVYVDQ